MKRGGGGGGGDKMVPQLNPASCLTLPQPNLVSEPSTNSLLGSRLEEGPRDQGQVRSKTPLPTSTKGLPETSAFPTSRQRSSAPVRLLPPVPPPPPPSFHVWTPLWSTSKGGKKQDPIFGVLCQPPWSLLWLPSNYPPSLLTPCRRPNSCEGWSQHRSVSLSRP